ncbi:hypothetical protein [Planktotalea sp.]|uniref:hypothetical protein n=1 Tax=Planktotalea sp. TaxID=2029877 RepID=UPI003D6AD9DE
MTLGWEGRSDLGKGALAADFVGVGAGSGGFDEAIGFPFGSYEVRARRLLRGSYEA